MAKCHSFMHNHFVNAFALQLFKSRPFYLALELDAETAGIGKDCLQKIIMNYTE
jgi:hypothetical protein